MDILAFFAKNPAYFLLVIAFLSLVIGSFLNVLIYRLPKILEHEWSLECREYLGLKLTSADSASLGLWMPFSHCPQCQKTLKPWHNIPVISYLVLAGKCAYCKTSIALRYPFVETLCCLVSVYIAWRYGFSWQTCGALFFSWTLIAMTFIDLDYHLLPDQLTFFLIGLGLFCSLFSLFCPSYDSIVGLIAGYLIFAITQSIFHLITGKIGMGQGDYKLLAGLGAFLGWQMLPIIILLSALSGIIFSVMQMIIKHQYKSIPIPYGPYLALAGWVGMIWGHDIMRFYLNLVHY